MENMQRHSHRNAVAALYQRVKHPRNLPWNSPTHRILIGVLEVGSRKGGGGGAENGTSKEQAGKEKGK